MTALQHQHCDLCLSRLHHLHGLHSPMHMWPRHLLFVTAVLSLLNQSSGGRVVIKSSFNTVGYLADQCVHHHNRTSHLHSTNVFLYPGEKFFSERWKIGQLTWASSHCSLSLIHLSSPILPMETAILMPRIDFQPLWLCADDAELGGVNGQRGTNGIGLV